MNLTVAFITSRRKPMIEWFFDSLKLQLHGDSVNLIIIDHYWHERKGTRDLAHEFGGLVAWVKPKSTIWQGEHRITKEDWWAKSNAMNTAIILCQTEWIAFVDDRSVLSPGWLRCVREAMEGNYGVCGSYEKRANMKVENGEIIDPGEFLGEDDRPKFGHPVLSPDWYGGSCALPLEWCLQVNGFPEMADGLGLEDCLFGKMLANNGFQTRYDSRMKIVEDRTPGEIEGALKRADKNVHLGHQAKSWALVRALQGKHDSQNPYDIRNMRDRVLLNSESLDSMLPAASPFDWYDQQPVSEME